MRDAKLQLEPFAGMEHYPLREHVELSRAISLKRIADALEKLNPETLVLAVTDGLSRNSVSAYGEPLAGAVQNSIERGLRGIQVPR